MTRSFTAFQRKTPLKEGDIVSLDMAATYQGFVGDTAMTVPVGEITDELKQLIRVTEECLEFGIEPVPRKQPCRRYRLRRSSSMPKNTAMASSAITPATASAGQMHESPQIPNYGRAGTKERIRAGYCFAIEPMLNLGTEKHAP